VRLERLGELKMSTSSGTGTGDFPASTNYATACPLIHNISFVHHKNDEKVVRQAIEHLPKIARSEFVQQFQHFACIVDCALRKLSADSKTILLGGMLL
jgi:hypothetical protein